MNRKTFVMRQNAKSSEAKLNNHSSTFRPETPIESGFSLAIGFNHPKSKAVSPCL